MAAERNLPCALIVHAGDATDQTTSRLRFCLRRGQIDHVLVPRDVPAGRDKHVYICDVIKQNNTTEDGRVVKASLFLLITPGFLTCKFCDYVVQRALHEGCLLIPVLANCNSLPELIKNRSAIDINDKDFYNKLIEATNIPVNPHDISESLIECAELDLDEPKSGVVQVKKLWKNNLRRADFPQDNDYRVVLSSRVTRKGQERQDIIKTTVGVSKLSCREETRDPTTGATHGGTNPECLDPKQFVLLSPEEECDSQIASDGGQTARQHTFCFRFKKKQCVYHVYVQFDLAVYIRTPSGEPERVVVESRNVEFIARPGQPKTTQQNAESARVSGNEGDVEQDSGSTVESDRNVETGRKETGCGLPQKLKKPHTVARYFCRGKDGKLQIRDLDNILYQQPKKRIVKAKTKGPFNSSEYLKMMATLEKLGDNSEDGFEEFHRTALKYLEDCDNKVRRKWKYDFKVAIFIKMSGVAHYQNKLKEAKRFSDKAQALLKYTSQTTRLEARLCYYVSAIYRESKEWGNAEKWINKAQLLLDQVEPCEDTAKGYYNAAKLLMKQLTHIHQSSEKACAALKDAIVQCFLLAVQHFSEADSLDAKQVRRCLINMVSTQLQSPQTLQGRERHVTEHEVSEAARVLTHLNCRKLNREIRSKRQDIQVMISESEVCFRRFCVQVCKCGSYNKKKPMTEQRFRCGQRSNGTRDAQDTDDTQGILDIQGTSGSHDTRQDCVHVKEGLKALIEARAKLRYSTALSEKCGLKESKTLTDFVSCIDGILYRLNTVPCEDITQYTTTSGSSSDQNGPAQVGITQGDISDAFRAIRSGDISSE